MPGRPGILIPIAANDLVNANSIWNRLHVCVLDGVGNLKKLVGAGARAPASLALMSSGLAGVESEVNRIPVPFLPPSLHFPPRLRVSH